MKMILTPATSPDDYVACLDGWQRTCTEALRRAVREAVPALEERLKWGHLVYLSGGPVLLIRAEPERLLLGFWRGQRLRHLEPRLKAGGQYEMATLTLRPDTPLQRQTVIDLTAQATEMNRLLGDPTDAAQPARSA